MSIESKMYINGKEFLIPDKILQIKKKQKHRVKQQWCNLYFFKKRMKKKVDPINVKEDLVITSALQYQRNTFYKMSAISREDDTFDYYYKLKEDAPIDIVKKKNRPAKKVNSNWRNYKKPLNEYERSNDGKFVVRFD